MNSVIRKLLVLLVLLINPVYGASVEAKIYSSYLARGEKVLLEIRFKTGKPDDLPVFPEMKDVDILPVGFGPTEMIPGRRIEHRYQYIVSSYTVGQHIIPPLEVTVAGEKLKTPPIPIEVFNPDDLTWESVTSVPLAARDNFSYASIIKVPQKKIYQHQTVQSEIKIYVPAAMVNSIEDWGVPEFERDGIAAWRYEASQARGEVNLLGQSYVAMSYWTTLSPLRSGGVTLGPATIRLTYFKIIFDRFTQRVQMEANLKVPKYEFTVSPLPEGAPEGFDQAVGQFTITAATKQTKVTEGEPLALDVIVSGSGNLDNLRSPKLIDENGWKVYDSTAGQRGEERRELTGSVVFSQLIRPLELKTSIPPFRLVYFDPEQEQYQTVMTQMIPIEMTPAVLSGPQIIGPPQKMPIPVERMTDILSVVNTGSLLVDEGKIFSLYHLQVVFALIAFALIAKALWMRYSHLLEKDETKLKMKKDFENVIRSESGNAMDFLKTAGKFAETWLSEKSDEEIAKIIRYRDRLCFQKDKPQEEIPSKRRQEILRALKRVAFGLMIMVFVIPQVRADEIMERATKAYESAKYEEAAELWLNAGPYSKLSANTLYNIGNAAYRMGNPGEAALYYRRALVRDATHAEARQNLRFIEKKYGSITVSRPEFQYALSRIPYDIWSSGLWIGGWMLLISMLIFLSTRSWNYRMRVVGVVGFILAPFLITVAALGCYYYPNDAQFAPLARQAVIVADKAVLHTDASRTSPEVIDAPPGSLAEVFFESGNWAYVGFASQTRGWIPMESIEKIILGEKPETPKVRKSTADGSSA